MSKRILKFYKLQKFGIEIIYTKNSKISYNSHNHISKYIVGLLLSGDIDILLKNKALECSHEIPFVIKPYKEHSLIAKGEYEMITICINKEIFEKKRFDFLEKTIRKSIIFFKNEGIISQNQFENILFTIKKVAVDYIFENVQENEIQLKILKEYIENHSEIELSLEEISKKIFISKFYLIRKFKEKIGLTPHKFQIQNRIRTAKNLLQTEKSITEVAFLTGFYDQSHFIKQFKRLVGITPSEYKMACVNFDDEVKSS